MDLGMVTRPGVSAPKSQEDWECYKGKPEACSGRKQREWALRPEQAESTCSGEQPLMAAVCVPWAAAEGGRCGEGRGNRGAYLSGTSVQTAPWDSVNKGSLRLMSCTGRVEV